MHLNTMQQRNARSGVDVPVRRRKVLHPVYSLYHRSFWGSAGSHGADVRTLFEASSTEIHFATQLVRESLPSAHILSVLRVEIGLQHEAFLRRRSALIAELSTSGTAWSEEFHARWLFHGTVDSIVDRIVSPGSLGFDCGSSSIRNGRRLGHGTYFAVEARRAHRYTLPPSGASAYRRMLLCRALVGRGWPGNVDMRAPPPGWHSLCDNPRAPSIFAVQESAQACPCFVVGYIVPASPG